MSGTAFRGGQALPAWAPVARRVRRAVFAAGLALALFASARAGAQDEILRKDGVTLQGRVLRQNATEVVLDVNGVVMTLSRADIEAVRIGGAAQSPLALRLREIDTLIEAGRFYGAEGALAKLKSLVESGEAITPDVSSRGARLAEFILTQFERAVKQGEGDFLVQQGAALLDEALQPVWKAAFPGGAYSASFRLRLFRSLGFGHYFVGRSILERQGDRAQAFENFQRAAWFLGKQDFLPAQAPYVDLAQYLQSLFWQTRTLREQLATSTPEQIEAWGRENEEFAFGFFRDFDRAMKDYNELLQYNPSLAIDANTAASMEDERRWFRERRLIFRASASPTPALTPTRFDPAAFILPTPVPAPAPTPAPQEATREGLSALRSGRFQEAWRSFSRLPWFDYLKPALIALAALLGWLWLPRWILRKLEYRGNLEAAAFARWNRLLGPVALVAFLGRGALSLLPARGAGGGQGKKKERHKCQNCGFSLDRMEDYTDLNFAVCPNCRETVSPVYDLEDYVEHLVDVVRQEIESTKRSGGKDYKAVIERDAMSKLVRGLITLAVRRRASDLHVEPEEDGVVVRARIDGMLQEFTTMPKIIGPAVVSALKVMGNLDISEKRVPQDGRFTSFVDGAEVDVRINSAPSALGEKCSLRLLDARTILVDASRLGMDDETRDLFEATIRMPHGLMLVTGPTGSGKSTTLYVALQSINTGERNLISIEDPIEFKLKGVNQMQVNVAANFTFATGLRSILRQDPDVIMVGEIRDRETAVIAIEAAMTGHLVLSTLHTIDSSAAIGRLIDLGVEPSRFADALRLIIAQRLVRLVCVECAAPYKPKKSEILALGLTEEEVSAPEFKNLRGTGCDLCRSTGFFGRLGLYEMFVPTPDVRELIEKKTTTTEIRKKAIASGMKTLRQCGIEQARKGRTTLEEVIRVTA